MGNKAVCCGKSIEEDPTKKRSRHPTDPKQAHMIEGEMMFSESTEQASLQNISP